MTEKKFNLLHEPWIRVIRDDCRIEEVSLADALLDACEYRDLAGEIPTQDVAVLRLMLAVLHAVFEKKDVYGKDRRIETADDALDRWEALWINGKFPEKPLKEYFYAQMENFWLFHPKRPFFQVSSAVGGTEYDTSKLNGALSESSNKIRLFSEQNGKQKRELSFSEAARWLLYVNGYDDTSAKPTKAGKINAGGKMSSPGAGWLGKIGFVCVKGKNLFETLMLNFVLLDENGNPWSDSVPAWELEYPREGERTEIPVPHDQAALLTLQSRRIILHENNDIVTGYHLLGGDFFEKQNAFSEQMTVWKAVKDSNGNIEGYQPKRHDKARCMWRDFSSYVSGNVGGKSPGVIAWVSSLQRNKIFVNQGMLQIAIASAQYGDKDFFVDDISSDSLSLHLNLLSEVGEAYCNRIRDMISRCDKIAGFVSEFANDTFIASGGSIRGGEKIKQTAKEKYYYAVDVPFRKWISSLDSDDTAELMDRRTAEWCRESVVIADNVVSDIAKNSGRTAFIGKTVIIDRDKNINKYYSSSIAMQKYKYRIKNLNENRGVRV